MTGRVCAVEGHVTVDNDPWCLVCGTAVTTTDKVGVHVNRDRGGDLQNPASIATVDEWGPANALG